MTLADKLFPLNYLPFFPLFSCSTWQINFAWKALPAQLLSSLGTLLPPQQPQKPELRLPQEWSCLHSASEHGCQHQQSVLCGDSRAAAVYFCQPVQRGFINLSPVPLFKHGWWLDCETSRKKLFWSVKYINAIEWKQLLFTYAEHRILLPDG